jgi:hypothetical protein
MGKGGRGGIKCQDVRWRRKGRRIGNDKNRKTFVPTMFRFPQTVIAYLE